MTNEIKRHYVSGPSIHDESETVFGFLYITDSDFAAFVPGQSCPEEMPGLWIEHYCDGTTLHGRTPVKTRDGIFNILLDRSEWHSSDLAALELRGMYWIALEWGAEYDRGLFGPLGCTGLVFDSAEMPTVPGRDYWAARNDSTELNHFVIEYCAAHSIECDGGAFGLAFAVPSEETGNVFAFDVSEAIRRIEETADTYGLRGASK